MVNAANEVAVAAFLRDAIGFGDIYEIITATLMRVPYIPAPVYEDYVATNDEARAVAGELVRLKSSSR